ncbi:MAG: hypothetical protein ABR585_07965 [Gemmatimonadaceae bacterium]
MARVTPTLRAARTIARSKTTPYTALHLAYAVVALTVFGYLTLAADLRLGVFLAGLTFLAYGAGRYGGLARAWREEAPYMVEMEGDEDLGELPSHL